jgi:amino acid adenylation domain-containing protein
MNIEQLMSELADAGATLRRNGDQLHIQAPNGALSAGLVAELRKAKDQLLQMLDNTQSVTSDLPVIGEAKATCPLSTGQRNLIWATRLGSPAMYNEQAAIELAGPVDTQTIAAAFSALAQQHDILRTVFIDGEPMQQTLLNEPLINVTATHVENDEALRLQAVKILQQPFDLRLSLWRVDLFCTPIRPAVLVLTIHHAIFDRWSMRLLIRDFNAWFNGYVQQQTTSDRLSYRDFTLWQNRWMQTPDYTRLLDFWQDKLVGINDFSGIPGDHRPLAIRNWQGATERLPLPTSCLSAASGFSRVHKTTLFNTLFNAFVLLQYRYNGDPTSVTLTPTANRPFQACEEIVGYFVNLLPLVAQVKKGDSFSSMVNRNRESIAQSFAHQGVSIEAIAERIQSHGGPSLNQLVQTVFAFQNVQLPVVNIAGGPAKPFDLDNPFARFDLSLSIESNERGTFAVWQYSTERYSVDTIRRLAENYVTLLSAALASPELDVHLLPIMSEVERNKLLYVFNATQHDFPQDATIHRLFEAQAGRTPDAVALIADGETLSYGGLNRRANQLAHRLIALGVQPDDRVALCAGRSIERIVAQLAILKAGSAWLSLDPDYPDDRLAFMLEDAQPAALLTFSALAGRLGTAVPVLLLDRPARSAEAQAEVNPDVSGLTARHLACVYYTSGSTGRPKGVMVEHRSVVNLVLNAPADAVVDPDDCVAHCANTAFDAATWEVWAALLNGARLCIVSQDVLLDPPGFRDLMAHSNVSVMLLTAGLFHEYLDSLTPAFARLRCLMVGGDILDAGKARQMLSGATSPARFINVYGPTEATTFTITHTIDALPADATSVPIGRPIANARVYLLDRRGQPVPRGVPGELYVGGAGVARGYLNRPELTAERFLADPFSDEPDARMYRTGDLARWLPGGALEFLGRNDSQIKLRGFRIEPGEIEAALMRCDGVHEAVVAVREDVSGDRRLVAYLLAHDGAGLAPAALRRQLAGKLPDYMLPAAFVTLDSFPLTPNGKLDRAALPAPDGSAVAERAYSAPQGEVEEALAGVWQELLGLERVGRDDNFFELGGHSLLAITLSARLRGQGLSLPVRAVFTAPVLAEMAQACGESADDVAVPENLIPVGCRAITPEMLPLVTLTQEEINSIVSTVPGGAANLQDIYPLAPLQSGILFHHLQQQEGDAYLLCSLMAFDSRTRLDAFLAALQQVVDRHDVLRTTFCWQGLAEPVQVVWRRATLRTGFFTPDAGDDVMAQLSAHTDPRRRRMSLSRAPLMALDAAHDQKEDRWLLSLRFHHLIGDHLTLAQAVGEVTAILEGGGDALPPPAAYRNFVARARSVPDTAHEAFFRGQLADADAPTAPFGLLDVQGRGDDVREAALPLPDALAKALRQQAMYLGISPGALFHLAWALVLAHTSGRDDVITGTVLLGRMQDSDGAAQAIGLFINTLPLRLKLAGLGVRDAALAAHRALSGLLAHEQAPLALAQRCSGVAAPLPLFSALLNYRHSPSGGETEWSGIRLLRSEERTNYPLTLSVDDLGEGFRLTVQAAAALDPARVAAYMANALQGLAGALAETPRREALALPLLPQEERHYLLHDLNATQHDFPQDATIHRLFEAQAGRTPDAVALIADGETLSYGGLNRRANQLAHRLIALGVQPDDRVALCAGRSIERIVAQLAILKAGSAWLSLDPDYPDDRLAFMLEDAQPAALLTFSALAGRLGTAVPVLLLDRPARSAEAQAEVNPDVSGPTARHLACVYYTSGSTGRPKGVMVEHRSVVNLVLNVPADAVVDPDDCVAHCANTAFDAATWEVWAALLNGARLCIISQDVLLNPARFRDRIIERKITTLWLTVGLFNEVLEDLMPALGRLRCLMIGGDVLDAGKIRRLLNADTSPRWLMNGYGPTETTTFASVHHITALEEGAASVPIGRPIANARVYLLDRRGQPVPRGVPGELYVGGAGVARGYLNRPELTAERFLADPFSDEPDARMYRTGDLARWLPGGALEFLGRNDSQIKLRGFRIEPGEIEAALMRCDDVREAVVAVREDVSGDRRLVAYLLAHDGAGLAPAALRRQLAGKLPDYMLPAAFVTLDSFPLTPNGKLDRAALPAPDGSAVAERAYSAPQGEVEEALAGVWQELLGLERVGRDDNFFELGGHSLLAITLSARLRGQGLSLPVRAVFTAPVLAEMAQACGESADDVAVPENLIPVGCRAITPEMLPLVTLTQEEINSIVSTVPGGAANLQDIYPLAPLQSGILFHHLQQQEGDAYLLCSLMAFDSRTRLDAFLAALQQVVDRHDVLRTTFCWQGLAEPVQVVWRRATLRTGFFTPDAGDDVMAQLSAHTDPRRRRMSLSRAPLMALDAAHDQKEDRWLLSLRFHHLIGDHLTLAQAVGEITAILEGGGDALPPPAAYRNFVARARSVPDTAHEAFFRGQLADADAPTAPFGLLDVQGRGDDVREAALPLPDALAKALRQQAMYLGISPGALFHLAWALVLAHTSGRDDVITGTVLLGRMQDSDGAAQAIGLFINTLPLRLKLAGLGVRDAALAAHRALSGLLAHEQAPLALAQRCSGVAAPLPLFSALLNYRHSPSGGETEWSGIRLLRSEERTNYPLTLSVDDLGEGFRLTVQAAAALDPARVAAYMANALQGLAGALAETPRREALALPLLPQEERHYLLHDLNATQHDFPQDATIHRLFEAQAGRTPDAVALIADGETLSYGGLNRRANQLAHRLIALGVQPDDRVALCAGRSIERIVAQLAILKAGGAWLSLDPDYPDDRLAFMLEDAQPAALLTFSALAGRLGTAVPVLLLDRPARSAEAQAEVNPDVSGLTARHLACVYYTSGSTGRPKGVMVEHRSVVNLVLNAPADAVVDPDDCVAHCANTAFDAATWEVWAALLNGARLCIVSQDVLLDPPGFRDLMAHSNVSVMLLTTGLFHEYLDSLTPAFARLRCLMIGGDALDAGKARQMLSGATSPARFINAYGPTEATTFTITHTIDALPADATSVPIGRPIANARVYLLDRRGQPVPRGVPGELYVGGAGVARGYLNRPELTAERFLADPFSDEPDARMYRTGDLARWLPGGALEFLGRNDSQIKLRGFRIEPGEIEAALMRCDDVREAVVAVREDVSGDRRLVAYLLAHDGAGLAPAALRRQLAGKLPDYMLPAAFVTLDSFPLTPNGKLDRAALPAPDGSAVAERAYSAPQGEVEEALAGVWQELLGLERVGRDDNFFELGGHSLLAITLSARLRGQGLSLPVRAVFTAPVLAEMAQACGESADDVAVPENLIPVGCRAITPEMLPLVTLTQEEINSIVSTVPGGAANLQDIYPLAPLQSGILFHHLQQQEGDAYLLCSLMAFDSRTRLDAFLAALQQVVDRHDVLRTTFCWQGLAEPVQVVWRRATLRTGFFTPDAGDDVMAQLSAHTDPRRRRMSLSRAPLMALDAAHDQKEDRWLLSLRFHHLIGDHLTLAQAVGEITAILEGGGDALPPPAAYRNFVARARSVPDTAHEAFFRGQLADADAPTAPFGLLDVQGRGDDVREAALPLPDALAKALRQQAMYLGISPGALFHLAWALVLAHTSGRDDVITGTVLLGRMQDSDGAAQAIGLFINTLPLRLKLAGLGVRDAALAAHRALSGLLAHEQAPLALAQRCSGVAAPLPLFSALLNYRHSPSGGETEWSGIRLLRSEERTNYPLTLSVDDLGEGFRLTVQAAAALDPARVAAYMANALQGLAGALAETPRREALALPLLPQEERHYLLHDLNATQHDFPQDATIHRLFEAQAGRTPDAVALIADGETLSYGGLNHRANQLAHRLIALGVQPDDRVALCAGRSIERIVAQLAILKAGGAWLSLDPDYPDDRLAFMLEDAQPAALLTFSALAGRLGTAVPVLLLDRPARSAEAQAEVNPDVSGPTARHLACVYYTSGSTGRPKGVMVEHRSVVNLVLNVPADAVVDPDDCVAHCANTAFDAATWEVWAALLNGARLCIISQDVLLNPARFRDRIIERKITTLWLTVGLFNEVLEDLMPALGRLRCLMIGGDVLDAGKIRRLLNADTSPRWLMNGYGPTETTTFASVHHITALEEGAASVPIGRPIANARVYLLDRRGQPVPRGVPGELYVGGAGVARGYLNRPELTAERFLADPFSDEPDARMYRTGDLARWLPGGALEFLGRNDSQIKLRGFRIEPGEIEAALMRCDGVHEAVVAVREDVSGDRRLVAYLLAHDGAGLAPAALRRQLAGKLPDYMLPAAFVTLDSFPLTPNGKLDRAALPAPDGSAVAERAYSAPQGEVEEALAGVWQELLGLERVGRDDNFFELGGHSLIMMKLSTRISQRFNIAKVSQLLMTMTIREQAKCITQSDENISREGALITFSKHSDAPPLFFAPGAGGHVLYLQALTGALDSTYRLWGMCVADLDIVPDSSTYIETLASALISDIRRIQPSGPYRLGGHSFGGLIAFEIARQLSLQGEVIKSLYIVDSMPPALTEQKDLQKAWTKSRWMAEIGNSFAQLTGSEITFDESEFSPFSDQRQVDELYSRLVVSQIVPQELDKYEFFRRVQAFITHSLAVYQPETAYQGNVDLIIATDDKTVVTIQQMVDGWQESIMGHLNVNHMSGNHIGIMRYPQVRRLASRIQDGENVVVATPNNKERNNE